MGSVSIGVDIGQKRDPTAVAVVEAEERADGVYFVVRYLERLPLGTSYPKVAERLATLVRQVRRRAGADGDAPAVFADATGVGLPVVDLLKAAGVPVTPVLFTHGDKRTVDKEQGRVTLGKAWLVSRLQALLQSGRLLLPDTAEARALAQELLDYEIRVEQDGDLKAGAFKVGAHDDLVTALGLATQVEPVAFAMSVVTFRDQGAAGRGPSFEAAGILAAHIRRARGEEPEPAGDDDDDDAGPVIAVAGPTGNPHDPRNILRLLGGRS